MEGHYWVDYETGDRKLYIPGIVRVIRRSCQDGESFGVVFPFEHDDYAHSTLSRSRNRAWIDMASSLEHGRFIPSSDREQRYINAIVKLCQRRKIKKARGIARSLFAEIEAELESEYWDDLNGEEACVEDDEDDEDEEPDHEFDLGLPESFD